MDRLASREHWSGMVVEAQQIFNIISDGINEIFNIGTMSNEQQELLQTRELIQNS